MAEGFIHMTSSLPIGLQTLTRTAVPSTQYLANGALENSNGCLKPVNAQTDKVVGVFNALLHPAELFNKRTTKHLSHASIVEKVQAIPGFDSQCEFATFMTGSDVLAFQNLAANANSTATEVKFAGSITAGDLNGGCIFANGEQRNITNSTISGGVVTVTVDRAFSRAITTGDYITATHLNAGIRGVKLSSAAPGLGISPIKGDESGGYVEIVAMELSLARPRAIVRFLAA